MDVPENLAKVRDAVPIAVPSKLLEQYPSFTAVLDNLYTAPGSSHVILPKSVASEIEEVRARLRRSRKRFFRSQVLLSTLLNVAENDPTVLETVATVSAQGKVDLTPYMREKNFGEEVSVEGSHRLCGLSKADFENNEASSDDQTLSILQQISDDVVSQCVSIAKYIDGDASTETAEEPEPGKSPTRWYRKQLSLQLAKASQSTYAIRSRVDEIEAFQANLSESRYKNARRAWESYRMLVEMLHILVDIIKRHKLSSVVEVDKVNTKWLIERSNTICLKLGVIKHQLLTETYTAETLPALAAIRKTLDKALHEADRNKNELEGRMTAYGGLDTEFSALVSEYRDVLDEIQHKEWALREIQSTGGGNSV